MIFVTLAVLVLRILFLQNLYEVCEHLNICAYAVQFTCVQILCTWFELRWAELLADKRLDVPYVYKCVSFSTAHNLKEGMVSLHYGEDMCQEVLKS